MLLIQALAGPQLEPLMLKSFAPGALEICPISHLHSSWAVSPSFIVAEQRVWLPTCSWRSIPINRFCSFCLSRGRGRAKRKTQNLICVIAATRGGGGAASHPFRGILTCGQDGFIHSSRRKRRCRCRQTTPTPIYKKIAPYLII